MSEQEIIFVVKYPDWMTRRTERRRVEYISRLIVEGHLSFADKQTFRLDDKPEQAEDWVSELFTGVIP